jgi:mono/diheme cytochrome c family protein
MRSLMLVLLCFGCTTQENALVLPGGGPTPTSGAISSDGLPCDVDALLGTYCRACHGARPSGGAPMSLVTYADLLAPAKSNPSTRVVDLCLTRIHDTALPMPPSPPAPSASEVMALSNWIAAGTPMGSCGSSAADPLSAAPTCTSATQWTGGNDGSSRMNPGQACISCHASGEGPRFAIAGTVYPTGHEPDLCNGTGAAQVIITDANGNTLTLTPNSAGNFSSRASLALPYHAQVVANGKTRAMSAAQSSGDCNSCHTQNGANGAPGRITLP